MLVTEKHVTNHSALQGVQVQPPSNNKLADLPSAEVDSKDLVNGTSNSSPYNTLSLGRKGKRGISQLGENDVEMRNSTTASTVNGKELNEPTKNFSGNFVVESPEYTLILPDINAQPSDFREFLKKDLIETSTLFSLELAGRLNWWVDLGVCRRLFPLVTIGDGNCLLHAASLALFGVHDNRLVLRRALSKMMCQSTLKDSFFRRWRWHQTIINKQSELVYTEDEWMDEWINLGKLASTQPRIPSLPPNQIVHSTDQSTIINNACNNNLIRQKQGDEFEETDEILYESLEELHVFVLAHVLKRTIIIIADTILKNLNGEPLAPISFGGIYLPLELSPEECHRSPLLLTYDAAHFSALVPMENTTEIVCLADAVPLVDPDFDLLPVHFAYDPGPDYQWSYLDDNFNTCLFDDNKQQLLKTLPSYLDIKFVSVPYNGEFENESSGGDNIGANTNSPSITKPGLVENSSGPPAKTSSLNRSNDSGVAMNSSVSNGGNNSSRAGSSESSNDETSNLQNKNLNTAKNSTNKDEVTNIGTNKRLTSSSINRNKKFSSFKKRLSRTFKMGLCASGIQQDLDEIEEHLEKKKFETNDNDQNSDGTNGKSSNSQNITGNDDSDKVSNKKSPSSNSLQRTSSNIDKTPVKSINADVSEKETASPAKQQQQPPPTTTTQTTTAVTKSPVPSLTELKCSDKILCARLYHKRDEVQDRILNRYLMVAKERFKMEDNRRDNMQNNCSNMVCHLNPHQTSAGTLPLPPNNHHHQYHGGHNNHALVMNGCHDALIQCINAGCEGFDASAETSYLCRECFVRQKQEEINLTLKISSTQKPQQYSYQQQQHSQQQQQHQRIQHQQQQQQQQQQYHYLNQPHGYSKFPTSSTSSSTVQLPLLKSSSIHPGPSIKHPSQSYHAPQLSLPAGNTYQSMNRPKTAITQSTMSTSTGLPRANMINSTIGAAAFNRSFEANHSKEDGVLTRHSYNMFHSPPSYKSSTSCKLINNNNNNNHNVDKRYFTKDSKMLTNNYINSRKSNEFGNHIYQQPRSTHQQMQQQQQQQQQQYKQQQQQQQQEIKFKDFQPIDSNQHTMYASEEDDDENDDEIVADEDYDEDDEEEEEEVVVAERVCNKPHANNNSNNADRQHKQQVENCKIKLSNIGVQKDLATNNYNNLVNSSEHVFNKLNVEIKKDNNSTATTTSTNNNPLANIRTLNVNYRMAPFDNQHNGNVNSTNSNNNTNTNSNIIYPQQQLPKATTSTNVAGPWASKCQQQDDVPFHSFANTNTGRASSYKHNSTIDSNNNFGRKVVIDKSSDIYSEIKGTKGNYITLTTPNYITTNSNKDSQKKH